LVLRALGRLDEAADALEGACAAGPDRVESRIALALARMEQGRLDDAVSVLDQALAIRPDHPGARMNLGQIEHRRGNLDAATAAFRRVLASHPDFADAHTNLGAVLIDQGELEMAAESLGRALARAPDQPLAHYHLGRTLAARGRPDAAVEHFRRAIVLRPNLSEAHIGLANLLQAAGRLEAAEAAYRRVLALRAADPDSHMNLAKALLGQGRVEEAMREFEAVSRLAPDRADARDAWLGILSYRPEVSAETLLAEHIASSAGTLVPPRPPVRESDPERRLRIGYVSGDFRQHPVGFFLAPVLEAHDPARVEVFCYSNDERSDAMTDRLRAAAGHWRDIVALDDAAADGRIREDHIDILVDLSGRTPGHRLGLLAGRPAPVQVSWLGYAATTGLKTIDYLMMDPWTAPPGAESWCAEALVRLPFGRFCYGPPEDAPEPAPPPSSAKGYVTFGGFNNLAKLNPEVAGLWSAVLRAVPGSRLVLKWASLGDPGVRRRIGRLFADAGAARDALEMRGFSPHGRMLAEYADIDIALDPFPFCGGLTSCEALWMGVPVVTWPGERFAARQTLGFLNAVGLADLAAGSAEAYVAIAASLAGDVERRAALRGSLRQRMRGSALCDARKFTPTLEAAYREMWRGACSGRPPGPIALTPSAK
jgi:predicted O-linked N-acetylglucosamine transferase (SPINDLY family)